ncbi:MAG: copper resistance CopC family protein [Actinomycetota bacterium]
MRKPAALLAIITLATLWGGGVAAQSPSGPRYVGSEPSSGEFVHQAPDTVSITFSEPLGPGSTMAVTDECGRRIDGGGVTIDDNQMSVALSAGPRGIHTVTYSAAGEDEASPATPGSFTYRVHLGRDCDGSGGGGGNHHPGDGGDGNGNGHGGHPGDRGDRDHGDHGSGGTGPAADHDGAHSDMEHDPSEHTLASGTSKHSHPDRDRKGGHHRGRKDKPGQPTRTGDTSPGTGFDGDGVAAEGPGPVVPQATGGDLVLALGLAAGFGAAGGVLLRFSRLG